MKNIGCVILLALAAAPLLRLGTDPLHLMIIALLGSYIVLSETLRIANGSQLHGIDPLFYGTLLILFIISMPKGSLGRSAAPRTEKTRLDFLKPDPLNISGEHALWNSAT